MHKPIPLSGNVRDLLNHVLTRPIGSTFECATSQYASNTTAPGHRFDWHSTPQAIRALADRGFIIADYRFRYYECRVISHTGDWLDNTVECAVNDALERIDEATGGATKKSKGPCGDALAYTLDKAIRAALVKLQDETGAGR